MNDKEPKDDQPRSGPDRTVYNPLPRGGSARGRPEPAREDPNEWGPAPPPLQPGAEDCEKTVPPPLPDPTVVGHSGQPSQRPPAPRAPPLQPPASAGEIRLGDILNDIYEVKRFIGRGGMGEVFEGRSVISDERVAIKVILPALAKDPHVKSMFLREARTLSRLRHEALVSYRLLTQEPRLGVLYIVTEFIDGVNLADVLGTLRPSPEELKALLRRLASGLQAAHDLGAIHRDMSPDNVLLEGGKLSGARIIDFGIAKDLDTGSVTIVGTGFAGKLSYVAPEQLGEFGHHVGPWTDVYSLGLVILAVAAGRHVSMGGSLVEAVDRRRAGPDVSAAPPDLRDVLARMLRHDPAQRLRSMADVLAALDSAPAAASLAPPAPPRPPLRLPPLPRPVLIGGGAALGAVLLLLLLLISWTGGDDPAPEEDPSQPPSTRAVSRPPAELARSAINSVLPSVDCSWLDIVDIAESGGQVSVRMTGVAGNAAQAQNEIIRAIEVAGVASPNMDFSEVSPITQSGCSALDTYRGIRASDSRRLAVSQRRFELGLRPNPRFPGELRAGAVFQLNIGDPGLDFAVAGIEPSGEITMLIPSRSVLEEQLALGRRAIWDIDNLGNDRYRIELGVGHAGWSGILMVTGTGPFPAAMIAPEMGPQRGIDWRERFQTMGAERRWQTQMVWFRTVDDEPNVEPSGDATTSDRDPAA